jgi:hypothetical protein
MKKILSFAAILLMLASAFTCRKEDENNQNLEFGIYENHEISACNVSDPLVNINWLKEFCKGHGKSKFTIEIYLYSDRSSINTILTVTKPFMDNSQEKQDVAVYLYNQFALKDCFGNVIMNGETSVYDETFLPNTPDWTHFFDNNENVGLIWAINKK